MARAGVYLSDVRGARDTLRAQGRHPSIDAVRIELGNTGSKSTIHKMLRQLEEEEAESEPLNVSHALHTYIEQLSSQLQRETGDVLERERACLAEAAAEQAKMVASATARATAAEAQVQQLQAELERERSAHRLTVQALQEERIARHTSEQKATDLQIRLEENEAHRLSLEEKHRHARESLEHFRQAAHDQRLLETHRHESEIQQLRADLRTTQHIASGKQEEVSRLNLEAANLVAELSASQRAHYAEQQIVRSLEIRLDKMRGLESQCVALTAQLEERKEWQVLFETRFDQMQEECDAVRRTLITTQLEFERANAELMKFQSAPDGGKAEPQSQ
ncbi:DNA-binding protein [Pseudoduganella sp. R-34]|uniref:DNA-binding protein n=1 Tax=Pseudoduganella sp. R-34 TaxID=3404062 RepID=UPI003CFBA010